MTMTIKEAAEALNENEYGKEGSPALFAEMKAAGLVAIFGGSDDLAELRGAINDEVGCYGGGELQVTPTGLLRNDCENDSCPHFKRAKKTAAEIVLKWDAGGYSWQYETKIPHAKFVILEDGEPYCEGIVFALADVPAPDKRGA